MNEQRTSEDNNITCAEMSQTAIGTASAVANTESNVKRTHCVSSRLNAQEYEQLKADAEFQHKKMGEILRQCYFGESRILVPEINRQAWMILRGSVVDLHRVVEKLIARELPEDLRPVLAKLLQNIHDLCATITGQQ